MPGAAGAGADAGLGAGAAAWEGALAGEAGRRYELPLGVRTMRGASSLGGGTIQPVTGVGSVTGGAIVPRIGLCVSAWTG